MGDTGLTGRKIIVDTYGGAAPHGGGAFSGKDPTKVDRSAAYAARYVAKNVVAAGLADRCQVQVSYAIGVAHPMSVLIDCFGTEAVPLARIERRSSPSIFDLRPGAIIRDLDLQPPIYRKTAAYGHFGRDDSGLHLGAHRQGRRSCGTRPGSQRPLPPRLEPATGGAGPRGPGTGPAAGRSVGWSLQLDGRCLRRRRARRCGRTSRSRERGAPGGPSRRPGGPSASRRLGPEPMAPPKPRPSVTAAEAADGRSRAAPKPGKSPARSRARISSATFSVIQPSFTAWSTRASARAFWTSA